MKGDIIYSVFFGGKREVFTSKRSALAYYKKMCFHYRTVYLYVHDLSFGHNSTRLYSGQILFGNLNSHELEVYNTQITKHNIFNINNLSI